MKKLEFKPKFVANAVEHMNDDHRDAMVDMLQGFCGANWVTDAEMLHFDKEKIQIRGFGAEEETEEFDLSYDAPLEKPKEFRPALMELLKQARALKNNKK